MFIFATKSCNTKNKMCISFVAVYKRGHKIRLASHPYSVILTMCI